MRQCHLTSAHTLTFSFTSHLCKQKYLPEHVPPETRKCFCGSNLTHERRAAPTSHDATDAHIFQTIFRKDLSDLGRDVLTSSNPGKDTGYSRPPPSTSCPVHHHIPHPAQFITFHIPPSSSPHSTSCPVHHHIPHPAQFITFHILPSSSHSTSCPVHHHIPHPAKFITTFHILSSSSPHSTASTIHHHIPHHPQFITTFHILPS